MALNIAERNNVGDFYNNSFSQIGKTFADVFERKQEERKKIKQADSATKSYLKAMQSFGMASEDQIAPLIEGDPSKPLTDNIFARQQFIEAWNANNAFTKQKKENELMQAQIDAARRKSQPMPGFGTQGVRTVQLPGGGAVNIDVATNEPIPNSVIAAPQQPDRVGQQGMLQDGTPYVFTSNNGIQVLGKDGQPKQPTDVQIATWIAEKEKLAAQGDQDALAELQAYQRSKDFAGYQTPDFQGQTTPPPIRKFKLTPVK